MKIKTLQWKPMGESGWTTDDLIPQVLYTIRPIGNMQFGLYFCHGYQYHQESPLYRGAVTNCRRHAQVHWNDYVTKHFLEN